VACVHVGAEATRVVLERRGGGYVKGTGRRWKAAGSRQRQAWSRVLCLLAGSYAESLVGRRSLARVLTTSGTDDLEEAARWLGWLVAHRHARNLRAAYDRAHRDTLAFLAMRWGAIELVAAELRGTGRLTGRQVRKLAGTWASDRL
jgi:hypothetical protein